ncbi:MAG: HAD family hydrolase [Treponema sp.]|jgi:putative hydrolase of the HAD superfamily|nr:HAD family hydrolase [Treponema sp.]
MRNGIEGIAFDLDGTLYPNYRLNIRLIPFILKEWRLLLAFGNARKIIRMEQEKTSSVSGNFYEYQAEIVAKLLAVKPEPIKEKIETLIYNGWGPLFKKIKLYNNVVETLTNLRKSGYKLALLSDFPPEKKLEYLGISGFWDAVLCSERCGAIKPHLLSFTELITAMALPCEKILYVGNNRSYDVAGAKRAGMKTAWIKSVFFPGRGLKKPKPDFIFTNYRQLYNYMLNY